MRRILAVAVVGLALQMFELQRAMAMGDVAAEMMGSTAAAFSGLMASSCSCNNPHGSVTGGFAEIMSFQAPIWMGLSNKSIHNVSSTLVAGAADKVATIQKYEVFIADDGGAPISGTEFTLMITHTCTYVGDKVVVWDQAYDQLRIESARAAAASFRATPAPPSRPDLDDDDESDDEPVADPMAAKKAAMAADAGGGVLAALERKASTFSVYAPDGEGEADEDDVLMRKTTSYTENLQQIGATADADASSSLPDAMKSPAISRKASVVSQMSVTLPDVAETLSK